ncbi:MAG: amidohydrolase [Cytophagales bacterium]|nr:amidohydrolase [Cytophagales bacterium]MDW8383721.1 amidohydrolase [Flammeovirgaceae bacterium]
MSQDLNVSLVQYDIFWQDKIANLAYLEELLASLPTTELVLLPEMFTTGFTMSVEKFAEPHNLTTFRWLQQMAKQKNTCIAGSYIVSENQLYYNRLVYVQPDGSFSYYNKRHLFRMGEEHLYYTAGKKHLVVTQKNWRIAFFICYDLRFPVWCRNSKDNPYDVAVFLANFPSSRQHVWSTLLKARAIENACYTIGVNRVGIDGRDIEYKGGSMIVNFKGEIVAELFDTISILNHTLSWEELVAFRQKFPVLLDADDFEIHLS